MSRRLQSCTVMGMFALALLVPGCKKTPPAANTGGGNNVKLEAPQGSGVAASSTIRAVKRSVELNDMHQLATLYLEYTDSAGMPPKDLASLTGVLPGSKLHQSIADGDVIVFWGVNGTKLAESGNTILAYPKSFAQPGAFAIPVALFNGTARNMTTVEFEKAPKGGM